MLAEICISRRKVGQGTGGIGKASRAARASSFILLLSFFFFREEEKRYAKLPGREIDKDEWDSWCSRDETINLAKPVRSVLPSEINRFL